MAEISRVALFSKLSALGYRTIDSATTFCKLRGHAHVELEHWVHQILQMQDSDLHRILRHFRIEHAALARDLVEALDRLPPGAGKMLDLSSQVDEAVERGWMYASLQYGESQVRTGHLVLGMLRTPSLRRALIGISRQFAGIDPGVLGDAFGTWLRDSPEQASAPGLAPAAAPDAAGVPGRDDQQALNRYTVDLTALARSGKLDPIVGRDDEIRQVIDILLRRRQNNPILTGEAGVGKTAVVEGLAQRIVDGNVPPALREVSLRTLDVGLLQAGASMKGEFEQRLRQVIDQVQASDKPIILFVDEAHTLVGAGGAAGTGDAANLLKPALARGTLRTIAATTWAEYKRHIEKDPALTRRFQPIPVAEPDEAKALCMLRSLVGAMESHHGVQVLDDALRAAVRLSHRYIPDRQLPDKAVSLLDTVCARVAVSRHATPAALDRCRAGIEALRAELALLERETAIGLGDGARAARIAADLAVEEQTRAALEARWEKERELVAAIASHRSALCGGNNDGVAAGTADGEGAAREDHAPPGASAAPAAAPRPDRLAELARLEAELSACQGEQPLAVACVDRQSIAAVVQDWTGIPVGRMLNDEIDSLLELDKALDRRIIGQAQATTCIARRIQTARAGLDRPGRPVGVFLLAGPSGVGKTETALALADVLYGGEHNVITLNMSEYQEAHTVSTLKGAPPGYVGYGEGGVLTEAVRRRPYSVVLLDEVEKAHPDVHEVFYQVFDKGWMEDGEGRVIDFRNCLILLTTNAGSDAIEQLCPDDADRPSPDDICQALRQPLVTVFPPALLGRMTTIPYYPLALESIKRIVRLQLDRLGTRLHADDGVEFAYSDSVVDEIASRCNERQSGARLVDSVLMQSVLPGIGKTMLEWRREGRTVASIHVEAAAGAFRYELAEMSPESTDGC
ncbi:type VI secretion system ATPase TssH [Bordetella genomosp. 11]|uniref:ClpV1 family T6SS ATPase n=1 Tax=Bordetella genomosp. 11 TaxID=1416808 RepID=A0A261UK03_9BORD|nr:type VI secretion system ATPase TssH [Bordetella genomosp. 11]OZI62229.1 ClpV1 family T6SS ATPase [Bordetella genomosp. 11]